ncbi:MAG: hypothetical protein Ct9H300mP19_08710 [Dehalococcoidia bacterium]|nr:MAG: hypothetical protein Ct9H300mP19_08710 [Dehalococcoidia bacterium]
MTTKSTTDIALTAHLLRRAGFGSDRAELNVMRNAAMRILLKIF